MKALVIAGVALAVYPISVACSETLVSAPPAAPALQRSGPSAFDTIKSAKCTFPVFAQGTWDKGEPHAEIKTVAKPLALEFEAIDIESGTARAIGAMAISTTAQDVIVQRLGKYLNFMQILRDGPLYTTTIVEQPTRDGKLMAIHSRHLFTEIAVPGFPSKPEQYYGDCVLGQ